MRLEYGRRYERPSASAPSWYAETLGEFRSTAVGAVGITVEILGGGGEVHGTLEGVGNPPLGSHGAVEVETDAGDAVAIPSEDIEAFTLDPEPPLDRSDELRG